MSLHVISVTDDSSTYCYNKTMLSKGHRLSLFISYVERSCCSGQCLLWAQTDMNAYERLETLVSERGVGKAGASLVDTKSIAEHDILLAQYDSASYLYRAQVLYHYEFQLFSNDSSVHWFSTQLNSTLKTDAGAMRLYIRICNQNFYATVIYSNVTL